MKQFNIKSAFSLAVAVALLSSCASIKKMKKNQDDITWTVTPEVLEVHGGQVKVDIQGQIPEKYFAKKATVEVTPVLVGEGKEVAYPAVAKVQGEDAKANNKVISYGEGGSFSYTSSIPYEEALMMSDLEVRITAMQGASEVTFDPIKIADGVIATPELVSKEGAAIVGISKEENTTGKYDATIDPFQRIVPDELVADIHYLINSSYVRGQELKAEDIDAFKAYAKDAYANERKELKGVEVSAYASPDGETDWNDKLAQQREGSSSKYIEKQLKKDEISVDLTKKYTAEDWDGFKEMMEKSNIQDKELILRVLSKYNDPEVREQEIRNLAETFTAVAEEILPELRRSKFTASVDLIGKTDLELSSLASSNPAELNQAELIYAASLTEDLNEKLQIFNAFSKQFDGDWRGPNNVGMVYVEMGEFEKAGKEFAKADKLDPNNPIVQNNVGVIELYNNEIAKAKTAFAAASGAGKEVDYNMGIVSIARGEYDKAVKYFGDCTCPNAALAKILTDDNNGALKTLEASSSEAALVDYLKAVVGARTAKESMIYSNLKAAIAKDASLKAKAAKDLEFANYFAKPEFTEIVK